MQDKDVTITIRFRGRLPDGVDAQRTANDLSRTLARFINVTKFSNTDFHVVDAWPTTVKDERQ